LRTHTSPYVHYNAGSALAKAPSEELRDELLEMLKTAEGSKRTGVFFALEGHVDLLNPEHLEPLLDTEDLRELEGAIRLAKQCKLDGKLRKRILRLSKKPESRITVMLGRFCVAQLGLFDHLAAAGDWSEKEREYARQALRLRLGDEEDGEYAARILLRMDDIAGLPLTLDDMEKDYAKSIERERPFRIQDRKPVIEDMRRLTGQDFGLLEAKDKEAFDKAIAAWRKWWESTGKEMAEKNAPKVDLFADAEDESD
jgi:hypothetical protein